MIYYVKYEEWDLTDLPTTVEEYKEWARNFNYHVVVTAHSLTCYNKFTNEHDAKRYAYTHDTFVVTNPEEDSWGY